MQTINLEIMTYTDTQARMLLEHTNASLWAEKAGKYTSYTQICARKLHTPTHMQPFRNFSTHTYVQEVFSPGVEACSGHGSLEFAAPCWNLKNNSSLMSHQQGIKREQKQITFSVEVDSL